VSTINLVLVSEELGQRITECRPQESWAQTADHIIILLRIKPGWSRAEPKARFAIRRTDAPRFRQVVRLKLESRPELWPEAMGATAQPSQEAIDAAVHDVQRAIYP
jgi:hypothetical protein